MCVCKDMGMGARHGLPSLGEGYTGALPFLPAHLAEDRHQLAGHFAGLVGEERDGHALGPGAARAADAVDVVLDVVGPGGDG